MNSTMENDMKPFRKLTPLLAALAILPAQAVLAGQNVPYESTYGYGHMGYGGWFFGPLMMILFLAILVGAVVLVLRLMGLAGPGQSRRKATDLLDERFARGEIDKAEFEERRDALSK
jgi:putative membrane protein